MDETYTPQSGNVVVDEQYATDYWGGRHLSGIRVSVRMRLGHDAARRASRIFPGTQVLFQIDGHGESAELEIPLRLADADIMPYLTWRDGILARIYQAVRS